MCVCARVFVCGFVIAQQSQNALVVASNFNQSHAGALLRKRGGREDTGGGYATGPVSSHIRLNLKSYFFPLILKIYFFPIHFFISI